MFLVQVHRCLRDHFRIWGLEAERQAAEVLAAGQDPTKDQGNVVYKYLQRFTSILNHVFVQRTATWFHEMLQGALGIMDYWYRFEFAKSRGAIHFHALIFKPDPNNQVGAFVNRALHATNMQQLKELEDDMAGEVAAAIAQLAACSALHPAGRERSNPDAECETAWYRARVNGPPEQKAKMVHGVDVAAACCGNVDQWPAHEGVGGAPPSRLLRLKLFQIDHEDELQDRIDFAKRVLLHSCSS